MHGKPRENFSRSGGQRDEHTKRPGSQVQRLPAPSRGAGAGNQLAGSAVGNRCTRSQSAAVSRELSQSPGKRLMSEAGAVRIGAGGAMPLASQQIELLSHSGSSCTRPRLYATQRAALGSTIGADRFGSNAGASRHKRAPMQRPSTSHAAREASASLSRAVHPGGHHRSQSIAAQGGGLSRGRNLGAERASMQCSHVSDEIVELRSLVRHTDCLPSRKRMASASAAYRPQLTQPHCSAGYSGHKRCHRVADRGGPSYAEPSRHMAFGTMQSGSSKKFGGRGGATGLLVGGGNQGNGARVVMATMSRQLRQCLSPYNF